MKKYIIKFNDQQCVELSKPMSTILVYRIPYQHIKNKDHGVEISNRFVVYILRGRAQHDRQGVYVGKSKNNIDNRPAAHEDKDVEWVDCYVLTDIKERTMLNDGTIQYLEDKICRRINETKMYDNKTHQTTSDTANHAEMEDCDEYLTEAYDMLYALGLDLLTLPPEPEDITLESGEPASKEHQITEQMKPLYDELMQRVQILNSEIVMTPKQCYIKAMLGKDALFDVKSFKKHLILTFNARYGALEDPQNLLTDMRNIGHLGNGDYQIKISDNAYLDAVIDFVNQVINL
jgi:predicted transport protein